MALSSPRISKIIVAFISCAKHVYRTYVGLAGRKSRSKPLLEKLLHGNSKSIKGEGRVNVVPIRPNVEDEDEHPRNRQPVEPHPVHEQEAVLLRMLLRWHPRRLLVCEGKQPRDERAGKEVLPQGEHGHALVYEEDAVQHVLEEDVLYCEVCLDAVLDGEVRPGQGDSEGNLLRSARLTQPGVDDAVEDVEDHPGGSLAVVGDAKDVEGAMEEVECFGPAEEPHHVGCSGIRQGAGAQRALEETVAGLVAQEGAEKDAEIEDEAGNQEAEEELVRRILRGDPDERNGVKVPRQLVRQPREKEKASQHVASAEDDYDWQSKVVNVLGDCFVGFFLLLG